MNRSENRKNSQNFVEQKLLQLRHESSHLLSLMRAGNQAADVQSSNSQSEYAKNTIHLCRERRSTEPQSTEPFLGKLVSCDL